MVLNTISLHKFSDTFKNVVIKVTDLIRDETTTRDPSFMFITFTSSQKLEKYRMAK